jgi:hypothetical protein
MILLWASSIDLCGAHIPTLFESLRFPGTPLEVPFHVICYVEGLKVGHDPHRYGANRRKRRDMDKVGPDCIQIRKSAQRHAHEYCPIVSAEFDNQPAQPALVIVIPQKRGRGRIAPFEQL